MNNGGNIVNYGDFDVHITNEIDNLILSIYDYAQKSNELISQIESIIDATKNCYEGPYAETYRIKFKKLCSQKQLINNNILSYKSDLIKVKNKFVLMEKTSVRKFFDN